MNFSPSGKLTKIDLKNTGWDAVPLLVGVVLTAGIDALSEIHFGEWNMLVAGVLSMLSMLVRRWLTDTTDPHSP